MDNNYLVHHGILGQKWGKKNGPPYPLDFSKLSAEERQQAKKDTIEKGDVKTANAYKNKNYYTNQELNELINRFDLNSRLQQKVSDIDKAKAEKGMKAINKMLKAADLAITIGSKAGKGFETYNKIKSELDKATNNGKSKKTFAFDDKKLKDILKNPDKFSDEELKAARDRIQTINNIATTKNLSEEAIKKYRNSELDKELSKEWERLMKENPKVYRK